MRRVARVACVVPGAYTSDMQGVHGVTGYGVRGGRATVFLLALRTGYDVITHEVPAEWIEPVYIYYDYVIQ